MIHYFVTGVGKLLDRFGEFVNPVTNNKKSGFYIVFVHYSRDLILNDGKLYLETNEVSIVEIEHRLDVIVEYIRYAGNDNEKFVIYDTI